MQNTLDPTTAASVLKQKPPSKNKSLLSKSIKATKKILRYDLFKSHMKKISVMKMIISPLSYLLDLIKDLMLMIQFAITQGGLETIIMQPEAYMLTVSNL